LKIFHRLHWLRFLWIFVFIILLWIGLVATNFPSTIIAPLDNSPIPGVIDPRSTTFGITIGAIVLIGILLSNVLFYNIKQD